MCCSYIHFQHVQKNITESIYSTFGHILSSTSCDCYTICIFSQQIHDKEMDPRLASIPQFCFPDLKSGMHTADYLEHHIGFSSR